MQEAGFYVCSNVTSILEAHNLGVHFILRVHQKKRETSVLQYVRRVNGLHVSYCVSGCWLVDVCDYHSEVFAASAGWVLQSALYN